MLIFICLFLPLSAYLATKFLLPPALLHKLVFPICASVILFSTVTVLYQLLTAVEWSDNTQIAWTSIETQENSLMVGGAPESSIVGWPNDNDTPQIKFSNAGAKRVTLEIAQSTALIVDEEQKTFLNGKTLAPEQAVNFAQNNITLHRGWFGYSNYLIVSNSQNEEVIRFSPPAAQKTSRVYSLELMINNHAGELRKDAAAFLALGDWAANLRVAVLSTGELRIISKDEQPPPADCTAPCSLNIIWSNNRLPFKVRTDNQRMSLVFAAPWRASSRLPPEGQNAVVVTKEPQPGDYAFVLPFGEAVKMTGQPLALTPDSSRNLISAPNSNAGVSIDNASIKSTAVVKIDKNYYGFATVQSLPHRLIITGLISLSVLIALIGLLLVAQSLTINYGSARWVFGGLFAVFWMLLLLRFALAIRYLLDPAYLDADTIKGFVSALIALAVCPAALAFLTKLYFDWQSRRSGTVAPAKYAFLKIATKSGYLLLVFIGLVLESQSARWCWAGLPEDFTAGFGGLTWAFLILVFGFFGLLTILSHLEGVEEAVYRPLKGMSFFQKTSQVLVFICWHLVNFIQRTAVGFGVVWKKLSNQRLPWWQFGIYIGMLIFVSGLTFFARFFPGQKFFQDFFIPLIFCWLPILFWLAPRLYLRKNSTDEESSGASGRGFPRQGNDRQPTWKALGVCTILTFLISILGIPYLIKDVGGLVSTLAFFLSATALLLAVRYFKAGVLAVGAVVLTFAIGAFFYANLLETPLMRNFGEGQVRLLNFREDSRLNRYLLGASVDSSGNLPLQKLENAYEHSWQNRALAHLGKFTGMGFNQAPVRRSPIPQATLRYDSVYSFFIASEYGLFGGFLLMLIYFAPLLFVLFSSREKFTVGHAAAVVVTSAMFLEALAHVGMDLGALPFTGRNLPLITVGSTTDLIRWTFLMCVAVQAILWRWRPVTQDNLENMSLIDLEDTGIAPSEEAPISREKLPVFAFAAFWVLFLPLAAMVFVERTGWRIYRDQTLNAPFSWRGLLDHVQENIDSGEIQLEIKNQNTQTPDFFIILKDSLKKNGETFLEEEAARFNALPPFEKLQQSGRFDLWAQLGRVKNLSDYQRLLSQAYLSSNIKTAAHRPGLFKIKARQVADEDDEQPQTIVYELSSNSEYNSQINFNAPLRDDKIPSIFLAGEKTPILGAAWVKGQSQMAVREDQPFSWLRELKEIATGWDPDLTDQFNEQFGQLSINRQMQSAAANFINVKGQNAFDDLLKAKTEDRVILPPRAAFTILTVPDGQVLAMSGFPQAASISQVPANQSPVNQFVSPSTRWYARQSPSYLRERYLGDRNFDQMVIGSTTKPLWAATALQIFPNLDKQLATRGEETLENDVFGINIVDENSKKSWKVDKTGWIDFKTYLARSDNRYQLRLGFLGLSEPNNGQPQGLGDSPSEKESLSDTRPAPWHKYPVFPAPIGFNAENPKKMTNLQTTQFARVMQNTFNIGIDSKETIFRRSFWTGEPADNISNDNAQLALFDTISPQPVNLQFDRINSPRRFVSLAFGGESNLWSNIDLAAAFATCVTGHQTFAHITQRTTHKLEDNPLMTKIAAKLRPGLSAVITEGTGKKYFQETGALNFLTSLKGVRFYAKSGTLKPNANVNNTSRIVLALVQWDGESQGKVKKGLVFSLVVEEANQGTATNWLAIFLMQNKELITKYFSD